MTTRHYLRVAKAHHHLTPEDVIGYVAWDEMHWPFRRYSPQEWVTEEVSLELLQRERWMMRSKVYKPFPSFP